jgi:flagellar motor switch protein FliN/FliY
VTTDPNAPIITPSGTPDDVDALVAVAAGVLVEHLVLGDRFEPDTAWPAEGIEHVFRFDVSGPIDTTLVVAVNDDVADMLSSDPATLTAGARAAVEAMLVDIAAGDALTDELEVTAVDRVTVADIDRPVVTVAVFDGETVSAVIGVLGRGAVQANHDEHGSDASHVDTDPSTPSSLGDEGAFVPQSFGVETPASVASAGPLSLLHDVDMEVTVELGRTVMPIRELLALQPGMVVEIDRAASAPIDVLVNGRRIASGEVVVIDEEFGVRITEIVTAGDTHR